MQRLAVFGGGRGGSDRADPVVGAGDQTLATPRAHSHKAQGLEHPQSALQPGADLGGLGHQPHVHGTSGQRHSLQEPGGLLGQVPHASCDDVVQAQLGAAGSHRLPGLGVGVGGQAHVADHLVDEQGQPLGLPGDGLGLGGVLGCLSGQALAGQAEALVVAQGAEPHPQQVAAFEGGVPA